MKRNGATEPLTIPGFSRLLVGSEVRELVLDLPLAGAILDSDGHAWLWNAAAERLFPPPPQTATATYPLFSLAGQPWFVGARAAALAGQATSGLQWRVRGAGGTPRRLTVGLSPVRDSSGQVAAILAVLQDTTARDRAYRRASRRVRWGSLMLDHLPDPVLLHRAGRIVYANRPALRLFGATKRRQLIGTELDTHVVPVAAGPASRLVTRARASVYRLDGTLREAELQSQPFVFRNRKAINVTLREVSEPTDQQNQQTTATLNGHSQGVAEEQLRQAQRMEAIGRLAGGIAHDFNNLLTAIQGHVQFLLDDLPEGHPSLLDALEIRKSADRAASLTRQLLTFSRREELQPKIVSLNDIISEMSGLLRRLLNQDVQLQIRLDPELSPVRADHGQLEQMIMNLVVNARDAMPAGGSVTVRTANIEFDDRYEERNLEIGPGPCVVLTVSDTGAGMDQETLAHIFEPFFTPGDGKGTGLALATVYGIVRQNGGSISVSSEPGKGTTFMVYLPRAGNHDERVPRAAKTAEANPTGETILLVEDEPAVRNLARRALEARGYAVLEAGTGADAIRVARNAPGPIHLMLSDVLLPDMCGSTIAQALQRDRPSTPLLFMSGYNDEDIKLRGMIESISPIIEKPFTPDALSHRVREVIASGFLGESMPSDEVIRG